MNNWLIIYLEIIARQLRDFSLDYGKKDLWVVVSRSTLATGLQFGCKAGAVMKGRFTAWLHPWLFLRVWQKVVPMYHLQLEASSTLCLIHLPLSICSNTFLHCWSDELLPVVMSTLTNCPWLAGEVLCHNPLPSGGKNRRLIAQRKFSVAEK